MGISVSGDSAQCKPLVYGPEARANPGQQQ